MSTTLGAVLAAIGAALLLTGRVAGLPVATHSVGLALLVIGGAMLAWCLRSAEVDHVKRAQPPDERSADQSLGG